MGREAPRLREELFTSWLSILKPRTDEAGRSGKYLRPLL